MTKRLVALIGAAVIVLAACQPGTPTTGPGESGGTGASGGAPSGGTGNLAPDQKLTLYLSSDDPPQLDAALAQDSVSIAVLDNTQRGLVYFDKDLNVVPELAEALPDVSNGGQTLTFKLKSGLKYSDGTPIVAGDFVRQFQHLLDPRQAAPYAYIACDMKGAADLLGQAGGCTDGPAAAPTDDAKIEDLLTKIGITAPDDNTVVVDLARPATYFTTIMAMWVATPREEAWSSFTEAADLGASGPFMVSAWEHNSSMTLVPNPNWGGTKPTLTEVDYTIGGDPEAALAQYEQGQLDTVPVPGTSIQRVADDPNLKAQIVDLPQLGITYYDFANCQAGDKTCPPQTGTSDGKSATANKNFRIALTQAVDKTQFINLTFGGLGQVANSMVMPGIPGYDGDYNPYPYDVNAAADHMKTALTELGVTDTDKDGAVTAADLGPMKFGYNCDAGHLPRVAFLAEAWRTTLGFTQNQFDISCTDFATFLQERPAGKYNISRDGWGADFPHAKNQLDLFTCGNGNNNSQYCNPQADQLFKQAATEGDPAKQVALYQQMQRMVVDDAPVIFLRFAVTRYLVQPWVSGLSATSSDSQNIGDRLLETISILQH
jgi:oligopeptide transport system substrate-binding protein